MTIRSAEYDYIFLCFSCLSAVGSLFLMFSIHFSPIAKNPVMNSVFYMAFSDLLLALKFILNISYTQIQTLEDNTWSCFVSSFLSQFASCATILWQLTIDGHLFMFLVRDYLATKNWNWQTKDLRKFKHVIIWLYCILAAGLPWATNSYGVMDYPVDGCWIADPEDPMRFLLYLPLIVAVLLCLCLLAIAPRYVCKIYGSDNIQSRLGMGTSSHRIDLRRVVGRLVLILIFFLVTWIPFIIDRGLTLSTKKNGLVDTYTLTLCGFMNAFIWIVSDRMFLVASCLDRFRFLNPFRSEARSVLESDGDTYELRDSNYSLLGGGDSLEARLSAHGHHSKGGRKTQESSKEDREDSQQHQGDYHILPTEVTPSPSNERMTNRDGSMDLPHDSSFREERT